MMKRKLLLSTIVVVVVAAAGIATVVLSTRGESSASKPCDIPDSVQERPASAKTAPGGGGIEVVEKGVSSSVLASLGAVLRNTSDHIAYRTRVALKVSIVANGVPQGLQGPFMTTEIPVMLPGQAVGFGRPLINVSASTKVTSAEIDPQTTTWLSGGALGGFAPTRDTYESTSRVNASLPADDVQYTERSANCRALFGRRTAVVFRDADGKIVGGDLVSPDGKGNPAARPPQPPASPSCSPGERSTWIVPSQDIPRNADDKRTELYSYCDLNVPPSDVNDAF